MSCYLVRCEGAVYANDELFIMAVAGGERAFTNLLAQGKLASFKLLDRALYPLTDEQRTMCEQYNPTFQDFDAMYRHINIVSKETVDEMRERTSRAFAKGCVIPVTAGNAPPIYQYRRVRFFRVQDYKEAKKYRMLPKMAVVRICGYLYVAVNGVSIETEEPIVVTIDN